MVSSQQRRIVPSTPETPMPTSMSLVSLNGTVSGVGSTFPCSKAIPVKLLNYIIKIIKSFLQYTFITNIVFNEYVSIQQ